MDAHLVLAGVMVALGVATAAYGGYLVAVFTERAADDRSVRRNTPRRWQP